MLLIDITKVEESFDIDSIYNKIFENCRNNFIITNGNNVLCYNKTNNKLKIYHRQNSFKILTYNNNFIKKFNKLGLFLQKRYKQEEKCIKQVLGQNFDLKYKNDSPFSYI